MTTQGKDEAIERPVLGVMLVFGNLACDGFTNAMQDSMNNEVRHHRDACAHACRRVRVSIPAIADGMSRARVQACRYPKRPSRRELSNCARHTPTACLPRLLTTLACDG